MRLYYYFFIGLILIVSSCKKQESPFGETPVIEFKQVTPAVVKAFKDSITFDFSYKDGDGDLGENNSNAENLFLTDNRINLTYKFRIKQLAPDGDAIPIQGSLSVILKNTTLTDSSAEQMATYSIYVIDRAGHKSNVITCSPIKITSE